MKALLLYTISFFILSTTVASPANTVSNNKLQLSSSTASDIFGRVSLHRQHNGTVLTWNILNSENIAGFVIERSYDGSWFETIGDVAVSSVSTYKYNDNAVYPGYVYYRIGAVMNDGSIVYSDVEMVRIVSRRG